MKWFCHFLRQYVDNAPSKNSAAHLSQKSVYYQRETPFGAQATENRGWATPKTKASAASKKGPRKRRRRRSQTCRRHIRARSGYRPCLCSPSNLFKGRGAVRIPKEFAALHLDFAKAQYDGHMGARFLFRRLPLLTARKFAQLNLARVNFYNPHLDIKVLRRPWAGKKEQRSYPCTATIYTRLSPVGLQDEG